MSIKWRMLFFLVVSGIIMLNHWMAAGHLSTDMLELWLIANLVIFGILYHQHRAGKPNKTYK